MNENLVFIMMGVMLSLLSVSLLILEFILVNDYDDDVDDEYIY